MCEYRNLLSALEACRIDDARPMIEIGALDLLKFSGCRTRRAKAHRLNSGPHTGILHDGHDLGLESLDRADRRSRGRIEAVPARCVDISTALTEGRHIRQSR